MAWGAVSNDVWGCDASSRPSALSYQFKSRHLTNKEAVPELCSVVEHAGSGYSTKEVQGVQFLFFPVLADSYFLLFLN